MNNLLIITYWSYNEGLIQAYTLPYLRIIKKNLPQKSVIYLLTLEKDKSILKDSERLAIETKLKNEGITWLPIRYRPFGVAAFVLWARVGIMLSTLIIRKRISVIHCWCTPAGAIGYILCLILNRKLVIDSYEPHAEAMVENGTWKNSGLAFRLLFWLEKKQTQRAAAVISATQGMYNYSREKYGVDIRRFYVKPACVDLALFSEKDLKDEALLLQHGLKDKIVCVYAGKFGGIYLEKEVFEFLKVAADHWGSSFRVLLLTNHSRSEIIKYCQEAGLSPEVVISTLVPHQQVPRFMGLGDFALSPVKPIETKKYCTPIKDGEYWALGLPVVIPANISDDSRIIDENGIGAVLPELDIASYKKAVEKIDTLLQRPKAEVFQKIRSTALRYRSYEIAERVYKELYGVES